MALLKSRSITPVFKPKRSTTIIALLIISAGIVSGIFAAMTYQTNKSQYLVGRAQTIADSLPASELLSLQGNEDDLSTLAYSRSKSQLRQVQSKNLDISYIKVFKVSNNRVSISVDAQPTNSSYNVSPGYPVPEPSNQLRTALLDGRPSFDSFEQDYSEHWVAGYAPISDSSGNVFAAVGVFSPATNYYLEIALYALVPILLAAIPFAGILRDIKLQSKEHEIMHLKNQFISIASHELRSPLTGMLWGIQALQRQKLSSGQQEVLNDMYLSTESSIATVNEILDSSIFERKAKQLDAREVVDINAIISQVSATLKLGAREKDLSIVKSGNWPEKCVIKADVESLKRSFMNIVSNAIKYSHPESEILISYRLDDNKFHVIAIKDTGIGIPISEQEKVLEGYYRASNANKSHSSGTGLGLWTSRMTIEQHGGKLWINSVEDKGTTVYVALPDAASRESKQPDLAT